MDIISTTLIKTATKESEIARYSIEYSLMNGNLQRIQIAMTKKIEHLENADNSSSHLGDVYIENNLLSCSMPAESMSVELFAEVMDLVEMVRLDCDKNEDQ